MIRLRDFIRVEDCYFSVVGYEHRDGVKCLLRYVPSDSGDRIDRWGRRYRKLSHGEALQYEKFREFQRDGIFVIPHHIIDEIYKPDEMLKEICKRDEEVAKVADFFRLPKMGVTGSRLIGLKGKNSDVDFVVYGRNNFEFGRKRIAEGLKKGELEPPDLVRIYERRKVTLPFEIFRVHEERKFNKAVLDGIQFDLLFVCDRESSPIPEKKGKKLGIATITARVTDSRLAFDYPACYFVDHPEVRAVLSFTHTFVGQAFDGETIEARGVVEEINGEFYLIVGTLRETQHEYIVSTTLLNKFNLEDEFKRWKAKAFKCSSDPSSTNLKSEGDPKYGGITLGR